MIPVDRIVGNPAAANYAANSPVDQVLPRVSVLDHLSLRVSGTLTLASYSVAPTKLAETPNTLIQSMQLVATGAIADTIKATDFTWLHRQTQFLEGTQPYLVDVGTGNQAYAFETNADMYFASRRFRFPFATLLDARLLSELTLRTQWRDQTALVQGGTGGTATLSNTQLAASVREYYRLAVADQKRFGYLRESQINTNIAATQQELQIPQLPVGNLYRRLCFKGTLGAGSYFDPSDTVFNNPNSQLLKIRDGASYPISANYFQLRAKNKKAYGIEAMPSGYALWEPVVTGLPQEQYPTRGKNQLVALADVNYTGGQTNTLQLTIVEHVLPPAR